MEVSISKTKRIESVDALRGFAILGILLVHNMSHFHFPEFAPEASSWLGMLDNLSIKVVQFLFSGKTYAIFTILFGFSFYVQHNNQKKLGKDFGGRFLWRMILLAVFATFNASFFLAGDVLILFVLVSPILYISRNWSDKAVLILSIILLIQPVEWVNIIISQINPSYHIADIDYATMHNMLVENARNGNILHFLWFNATFGVKVTILSSIYSGALMQFAGLFLMGFYIGRKQFFVTSASNIRFWKRVMVISIISFIAFFLLIKVLSRFDMTVKQLIITVFEVWGNLSFTSILLSTFILVYEIKPFRHLLSVLRYYGKMSLTNYIMQSVFGAFIYLPIGLYLAPYCGYFYSLIIALLVFTIQIIFSRYWINKYKQGPAEKIWHKWTWIKS